MHHVWRMPHSFYVKDNLQSFLISNSLSLVGIVVVGCPLQSKLFRSLYSIRLRWGITVTYYVIVDVYILVNPTCLAVFFLTLEWLHQVFIQFHETCTDAFSWSKYYSNFENILEKIIQFWQKIYLGWILLCLP